MAGLELKITVKELQAIDPRLAGKWGHALAAALGLNVEREGKRNAPKKTGHLQRSIRSSIPPGSSEGAVIAGGSQGLSTPVIYAAIQEWGGVIKPKSGKFLRFEVQNPKTHALSGRRRSGVGSGQVNVVFAKKVKIKGTHYMARGVKTVQGRATTIAAGVIKELTK